MMEFLAFFLLLVCGVFFVLFVFPKVGSGRLGCGFLG